MLSQLPQTPNLERALRRTSEADRERRHAGGVDGTTPRDANPADLATPPPRSEVNYQPAHLHESGPCPARILAIGTLAEVISPQE